MKKFEHLVIEEISSEETVCLKLWEDQNLVFQTISKEFSRELKMLKINEVRNTKDFLKHNHGLGTFGLQLFLRFIKKNGFERITGDIAPVDWSNRKKLKHFYKKNGFKVKLNYLRKEGNISTVLS